MAPAVAAVVTAAGSSSRMGGLKKEYRLLGEGRADDEGRPLTVLGAVLSAFASCRRISTIVITVPPDAENGEAAARAALPAKFLRSGQLPRLIFVPGGASRRASIHRALNHLSGYSVDYVLVHDGARPWVDRDLIERTIDAVLVHGAVVPVLPLVETPKELDGSGFVVRHLRRSAVAAAQTPQAFAFSQLLRANLSAEEAELAEGREFTDDAEIWGSFVGPVATIPGSPSNRKITFPEDLP